MRKSQLKRVSFKPFGKKSGRFRLARKANTNLHPWNIKREIMVWFALFCLYGSATATLQYDWNAGYELLKGAAFQGLGAGLIGAAMAGFLGLACNRKSKLQRVKVVRNRL
jgi:hypothetical protein